MLHSRMLHYVDEVARAGSIRKAATRLNVSATAVNRQILLLEQQLGTQVFHRLSRTLRLTAVGEILVEHVRRTLKDFQRMELRIEDIKGLRGGEVTIATMNGLVSGIIPHVVRDFCARHPRVRINSQVLFIREIVKAVAEGDADLGVAYNLPRDARLEVLETFDAELGAVMTPSNPLAKKKRLRLSDCADHPLILASPSMIMHQTVMDAFLRADLPIEPAFQSNSIEFMKCLAVSGEGIAFLSRYDISDEEAKGALVYLTTGSRTLAENKLSIVCRSKGHLDTAATLLAQAFQTRLQGPVAVTG